MSQLVQQIVEPEVKTPTHTHSQVGLRLPRHKRRPSGRSHRGMLDRPWLSRLKAVRRFIGELSNDRRVGMSSWFVEGLDACGLDAAL